LDSAYIQAAEKGHMPRILLLSHPQNPLGICYPDYVIQDCVEWCRDHELHLVCDEIYAGSVYGEKFESVLKLADRVPNIICDDEGLGPFIHWVYALSKDFGLSGLRVGAVYTENQDILLPLQKLNDLCQISSQTQLWAMNLMKKQINDTSWIAAFRKVNHERLLERSERLTALLDKYEIPYLPPTAGMFLWIDLTPFVPGTDDSDEAKEKSLYNELVRKYGLLLTPGLSMRMQKPGFFRCVFTAATDAEFEIALQRFEKYFKDKVD
jgi:aspartate/methionine/tyrosine aminotransferase